MFPFRKAAVLTCLAVLLPASSATAASTMTIRGGGFGHGVGMSQYGALGFAQKGTGYREILGHYYTSTSIARLDSEPTVRVLLQSGRSAVRFTGAAQAGDRRLTPGEAYRATPTINGQVVLATSSGRKLRTLPAPLRVVGSGGAPVRLVGGGNSGTFRGALEIAPGGLGALDVVNAVGLESYVRGVVAAESPSSWPAEALKAQAVAARTYAITTNKPGAGFDHYADTRSQVYGGVGAETATTDAAVAATSREVVTYQGKPVVTYFFSTSGGKTENVENSLGGNPQPWLKSVDDPYDKVSPRHRWGPYKYTLPRAGRKLGGLVKGSLKGIVVKRRGASPRIVSAEIVGSRGRTTVDGATLRRKFGLFDTWAYFTTIGTKVEEGSAGAMPMARGAATVRSGNVTGTVTGVARRTKLVVERRNAAGVWLTEVRTHVGKRGRYNARVGRAGVYRVRVSGAVGPAVRLK